MQYLGLLNLAGIVALFVGTHVLCRRLERRYGIVSTREAAVRSARLLVDALRAVGRGAAARPAGGREGPVAGRSARLVAISGPGEVAFLLPMPPRPVCV